MEGEEIPISNTGKDDPFIDEVDEDILEEVEISSELSEDIGGYNELPLNEEIIISSFDLGDTYILPDGTTTNTPGFYPFITNSNGNMVFGKHVGDDLYHFEGLMDDILNFVDYKPSDDFISDIKKTAEEQRSFKSGHKYDLEKFGLTEERIKKDCSTIYTTFLN